MKDTLGVSNHISPQTAGPRENLERGVEKKEPDEQKSATPGGDFPLPFFLLEPVSFFPPNMSDWNVSYRKGCRFCCMANSPTKCCLREQTESAVWDSSQALIRNLRQRRSNVPQSLFLWLTPTPKAQNIKKMCQRMMMRVTSTYPKSSREYMSAKKTVQSSSQRWKGGVTERDYGGEGEVSAREERAARMPEQSQPWALLHIFRERKNDPDMPTEQTQDRRRTERVGGKERGGERTRWGVLQRSKGNARERERERDRRTREQVMWLAQTSHLSPHRGLKCPSLSLQGIISTGWKLHVRPYGKHEYFYNHLSMACRVQEKLQRLL